jgi:hypothetical protein
MSKSRLDALSWLVFLIVGGEGEEDGIRIL